MDTPSRETSAPSNQLNGRYVSVSRSGKRDGDSNRLIVGRAYDHRVTVIGTVEGSARAPLDFGKERRRSMAAMSTVTARAAPAPRQPSKPSPGRASPWPPSAVFLAMIREIRNSTVVTSLPVSGGRMSPLQEGLHLDDVRGGSESTLPVLFFHAPLKSRDLPHKGSRTPTGWPGPEWRSWRFRYRRGRHQRRAQGTP